jgi:hypothetical protein
MKLCPSPLCPCKDCQAALDTAERLVDREADLRDLEPAYRPFVLHIRERRRPTRTPSGGVSSRPRPGGAERYDEGEDSPWHENAVGYMEDGE